MYFETGEKEEFEMEPMEEIRTYIDEDNEIVKVAVKKDKYLMEGEVSKWYITQKAKERRKEDFIKHCHSVTGLIHLYIDKALQTALYSIAEYKNTLQMNDIYQMKCIIGKLMKGQDKATIYKDIAKLLACKPDGKDGERERFFREFSKCVEKLLNRPDMNKEKILDCLINSIFVHGAQSIPQLRDEVKKEVIKQVWEEYQVLIIKWNEYCLTLDNMGFSEASTDHITANKITLKNNNISNEEEVLQLIANKLFKLKNNNVSSDENTHMKKLLSQALMRKFKGRCWNCWEEGSHSAANCPIKEIAICGKCKGGHHTNACESIKEVSRKRLMRKSKTQKPQNKKKAYISSMSMDEERLQMCLANVLYETNNSLMSEDSEEEDNLVKANTAKTGNQSDEENDSDDSEGWATGSGSYYIGESMNTRKSIYSNVIHAVIDESVEDEDVNVRREDIINNIQSCKEKIKEHETEINKLNEMLNQNRLTLRDILPRRMKKKILNNIVSIKIQEYNNNGDIYNDKDEDDLKEYHTNAMRKQSKKEKSDIYRTVIMGRDPDIEKNHEDKWDTKFGKHLEYHCDTRNENISSNIEQWGFKTEEEMETDIVEHILSYTGEHLKTKIENEQTDINNNDIKEVYEPVKMNRGRRLSDVMSPKKESKGTKPRLVISGDVIEGDTICSYEKGKEIQKDIRQSFADDEMIRKGMKELMRADGRGLKTSVLNDARIIDKMRNMTMEDLDKGRGLRQSKNRRATTSHTDHTLDCEESCNRKNVYTANYMQQKLYCSSTLEDDTNMQDVIAEEGELVDYEYNNMQYEKQVEETENFRYMEERRQTIYEVENWKSYLKQKDEQVGVAAHIDTLMVHLRRYLLTKNTRLY